MIGTDNMPIQKITYETPAKIEDQAVIQETSGDEVLNQEQLEIISWLKEVRFRKQLFGGVNELDVWKKIEELNEMYEAALKAERIRYDVLLEQQTKGGESSMGSSYQAKDRTADD